MNPFNKVLGAGLRHGYVRTSDDTYDINAIVAIEADNEQEDVEVRGDDQLKAVFSSARRETLTIRANGLTFDVIQALTGNSVSSSATGMEIPLGTASELNPPFVEVGGMTNGKTDDGSANVVIHKIWHRVQINSIVLTMEGESEFSVEMTGQAVYTETDITGASLGTGRTSTIRVQEGQA